MKQRWMLYKTQFNVQLQVITVTWHLGFVRCLREHSVSESGSVSVLRRKSGNTSVGCLGKSSIQPLHDSSHLKTKRKTVEKQSCPATHYAGRKAVRRYSSYSFLTPALDTVRGQPHAPKRALPPVPIVQEAGWASEPVWTQRIHEKSFAPAGDRTRLSRLSVVLHYTDYVTYPSSHSLNLNLYWYKS
jgi:hypothetical protein